MIKIHDNKVPFHVQEHAFNFTLSSNFRLGWKDRYEMQKMEIHSVWSLDDLKNSMLYPYIEDLISFDRWEKCIVNLTKAGDHYYAHAHGDNSRVILYYANLEWHDEWGGETVFYDHNKIITNSYQFVPGRLLEFDGSLPHSIRPQSFIGPQYRLTISNFFKERL